MIIVADPEAARQALAARRLGCPRPGCAGQLRPWSRARARRVQALGGDRVLVRPDRGLCTACGATQVLLTAACLPRRAYTVHVVGAVLADVERGQSPARAGAEHAVPASTARSWVRAVSAAAGGLTAAVTRIGGAHADPAYQHKLFAPPAGPIGALTGVLEVLGSAA